MREAPVVCEREAPELLWSVDSIPVLLPASLSISDPDLIELYIGPEVSFDCWHAANVLGLAQLFLQPGEDEVKCICLICTWICCS